MQKGTTLFVAVLALQACYLTGCQSDGGSDGSDSSDTTSTVTTVSQLENVSEDTVTDATESRSGVGLPEVPIEGGDGSQAQTTTPSATVSSETPTTTDYVPQAPTEGSGATSTAVAVVEEPATTSNGSIELPEVDF